MSHHHVDTLAVSLAVPSMAAVAADVLSDGLMQSELLLLFWSCSSSQTISGLDHHLWAARAPFKHVKHMWSRKWKERPRSDLFKPFHTHAPIPEESPAGGTSLCDSWILFHDYWQILNSS